MREIIAAQRSVRALSDRPRRGRSRSFQAKGEKYKAQLIQDLPADQTITLYSQGDWIDLCRGPHMRSTGDIGPAFKLMKRGRRLLARRSPQRHAQPDLRHRLARPEGARRPSAACWRRQRSATTAGSAATWGCFISRKKPLAACSGTRRAGSSTAPSKTIMRRRLDEAGYQEVRTPQLVDRSLWEASGHWEKFREHMFVVQVEDEDKFLALKPMNCPCHVQIFNQGMRSYRELPLRMAEFGACHRYRAFGRAARHHAGARLYPGRCAYLLHRADQVPHETARSSWRCSLPSMRISAFQPSG